MSADLIPTLLHQLHVAQERAVLEAFARAGAVSPATARPRAGLPTADAQTWSVLVEQGRIREGAPGTFYRYEPAQADARTQRRRLALLLPVLIGIPVFFLWLVGQ